jgi:hypothetical protein
MRLQITVDIGPEELATQNPYVLQLIEALRSLNATVSLTGAVSAPLAAPPVVAPAPVQQTPGEYVTGLLQKLGKYPHALDETCAILTREQQQADSPIAQALKEMVEGGPFFDIMLTSGNIRTFVQLLSRLGEPLKATARGLLVKRTLQVLTVKRPIECDRREFFANAECFAAMLQAGFLNVSGKSSLSNCTFHPTSKWI